MATEQDTKIAAALRSLSEVVQEIQGRPVPNHPIEVRAFLDIAGQLGKIAEILVGIEEKTERIAIATKSIADSIVAPESR